jgi:hypothetical protein
MLIFEYSCQETYAASPIQPGLAKTVETLRETDEGEFPLLLGGMEAEYSVILVNRVIILSPMST